MRSHLAKSIVGVAMCVALFACVPKANAQVRGLYMPGVNTTRSAPPEAGLTYAVIVVIPIAITPLSTITFGKIAGREPSAVSYFAPVVLSWRSDRQTMYLARTCRRVPGEQTPAECPRSGTNVIWSATIRF
jgi:hypothetical protein